MSQEIDFAARMEAVRQKAIAAGVRFVSEDELRRRCVARETRRTRPETGNLKPETKRKCETGNRRPEAAAARMPYKDVEEEQAVTAKDFSQRDFTASGAASSANDLLVAWFRQPKHFGKWFTKKFLEDEVMQGKSGCCNNRAKDCRDYFISGGLYIDNKMIEVDGRLQSHYALVRIEDAVSLDEEKKRKILATEPVTGDNHR